MSLSRQQREGLKDDEFAFPTHRLLPLVDRELVLMASNNFETVRGVSEEEREQARIRIHNRASELGVKTKANRFKLTIESMSLDVPILKDHPNRHPFTGIMTRLNVASDFPVGGTTGKKVVIPEAVAKKAIPTLLGMAIDYTPEFDGHDKQAKIGIITEAWIGEEDIELGTPLHISGFFYAADFPSEVAAIQNYREQLGFSYEAQANVDNLDSDPWVCTSCDFTGAAVLFQNKAAFSRTSIAASQQEDEIMTKEEIEAMQKQNTELAAANKKLAEEKAASDLAAKALADKAALQAASLQNMVKPHADALRACAKGMLAAGIGADNSSGHAQHLNKMADHMEAEAVLGRVPSSYSSYMYAAAQQQPDIAAQVKTAIEAATKPLQDEIAVLKTKNNDAEKKAAELAAAGAASGAGKGGTERKSVSASTTAMMRKVGLDASAAGYKIGAIDEACKKAALPPEQSMALKLSMREAGLIAA